MSNYKTNKSGLEHPVGDTVKKNEPTGKDINHIKIPLNVHDEFKGKLGKHTLKPKEGKYDISKGETEK